MDRRAAAAGAGHGEAEARGALCRLLLRRSDGRGDDGRDGNIVQPPFYYESLDLLEATHPQTILAYELNGRNLPVEHGAPVRLRAERQLGYKMPKYVQRIELVEQFRTYSRAARAAIGKIWATLVRRHLIAGPCPAAGLTPIFR